MRLDILDTMFQIEAAAKRYITHVRHFADRVGNNFQSMVIGPDALNPPHRPGSEAGAGSVGDAQIHGHPDHGDVQAAKILHMGQVHEAGNTAIGQAAVAIRLKQLLGDHLEGGIKHHVASGIAIFFL